MLSLIIDINEKSIGEGKRFEIVEEIKDYEILSYYAKNIAKLVILDHIHEITYVIPYDRNVYEDTLECIVAYSEEHDLKLHTNNISFMEVGTFKLEVL